MKFFDYKFIILLGLALVIYFIYKEVDYLRTRIEKVEHDMILSKQHTQDNIVIKPISPKAPSPVSLSPKAPSPVSHSPKAPSPVSHSPKALSPVSLSPKALSPKALAIVSNDEVNQNIPIIADISTTELESDSESETSESSEHVAIYSNDNETCDDGRWEDVVSTVRDDVAFNYNENNNNHNTTSSDDIKELIKDIDFEKISEKPVEKTVEQTIEQPLEENKVSKPTYTEDELDRMKLPDIKKIAETNNITLNKKVNGQQKPKTKKELIDELLKL